MKKLTTLVLALVMVFSLAACGNKNSGTTSKEDTNKTSFNNAITALVPKRISLKRNQM